jgi:nitrogen fixation protein
VIQLVGQQAMSAPVPRQKIDLPSMHLPSDNRVGGVAKRGFDLLLRGLFDAVHLVKTASADNANGWCVSIHLQKEWAQASSLEPGQRKPQGGIASILFAPGAGFRFNRPV